MTTARWEIVATHGRSVFRGRFLSCEGEPVAHTRPHARKEDVLRDISRILGARVVSSTDGFMWVAWGGNETGLVEIRDLTEPELPVVHRTRSGVVVE